MALEMRKHVRIIRCFLAKQRVGSVVRDGGTCVGVFEKNSDVALASGGGGGVRGGGRGRSEMIRAQSDVF